MQISMLMLSSSIPITIEDKLNINTWAFLTQLIAFIITALLVIKFAYKPVHAYLEKRKAFIRDNLDSAQKQNSEAQLYVAQARDGLAKSKQQASQIVMSAKKQAEEDKAKYKDDLAKELQLKRIAAEKDIELERKQALEEARSQMVDIALAASASVLGREISSDDNRKMVGHFVDELSAESEKDKEQ